jgi:hypothetical protein
MADLSINISVPLTIRISAAKAENEAEISRVLSVLNDGILQLQSQVLSTMQTIAAQAAENPIPAFSTEYYPLKNFHVAKKGDEYLAVDSDTGLVRTWSILACADKFNTDSGAYLLVTLYREQQQKQGVIVTPI